MQGNTTNTSFAPHGVAGPSTCTTNKNHRTSTNSRSGRTTTQHHSSVVLPPKPVSALTLLRRHRKRSPQLFLLQHPASTNDTRKRRNNTTTTPPPFGQIGIGITEIAGMAGSGKTQVALGLCVSCASTPVVGRDDGTTTPPTTTHPPHRRRPLTTLPPLPIIRNPYAPKTLTPPHNHHHKKHESSSSVQHYYKALYISMGEGCTPPQIAHRLKQMSHHRQQQQRPPHHNTNNSILSRVLTRFIRNTDEFETLVHTELPKLLLEQSPHTASSSTVVVEPIGLVVMDSIGGLFRTQEHPYTQPQSQSQPQQPNKSFILQRSTILLRTAATLKELSDKYQIPMVVINQVTSSFDSATTTHSGGRDVNNPLVSSPIKLVPSLGVVWSNCVNTSYLLTRKESTFTGRNNTSHYHQKQQQQQQQQQQSTNKAIPSSSHPTSSSSSSSSSSSTSHTRFLRTAHVRLSSSQSCSQSSVMNFQIEASGPIGLE